MHKQLSSVILFIFLGLLSACSATDADKIGEAQACLDKATTPSAAAVCSAKVNGIETAAANGIRCSANFIAEGFGSSQKIVDLLNGLEQNGLDSLLGLLTFTAKGNISADYSNAEATFQYCLNSGGKGSTLLMAFSNVTMAMYALASSRQPGACPPTPSSGSYAFSACFTSPAGALELVDLGNIGTVDPGTQAVQSAIGATIIASHRISCAAGSSANVSMCSYFNNAITNAGGTGNPRTVATEFIQEVAAAL